MARNQYGEAQQSIRVDTAERPNFTQTLSARSTVVGKEIRLEARVEGTPFPDVKWVKVGFA
jgi:hypothetical protein